MSDLALTTLGDLSVTEGLIDLVYDDDAIVQSLDLRLRLVLGEWFRDQDDGTDWFGDILGKVEEAQQRAELRRRILGTGGVASIAELTLTVDTSTRTLSAEVTVIKDDGWPLEVQFAGAL